MNRFLNRKTTTELISNIGGTMLSQPVFPSSLEKAREGREALSLEARWRGGGGGFSSARWEGEASLEGRGRGLGY